MASKGYASDTLTPGRAATAYSAYANASDLLTSAATIILRSKAEHTSEALLILPTIITDDTAEDRTDLAADYAARALHLGARAFGKSERREATEMPTSDLFTLRTRDHDTGACVPMRPGACTTWRDSDTLDAVTLSTLDYVARAILDALRTDAAWQATTGEVNREGVARHLVSVGTVGGMTAARRIVSERLADVLADARQDARHVATWAHVASTGNAGAIATDRDIPESGTASAVVLTRPNGDRWTITPTAWHKVDDAGVRVALARTDVVPAYVTPTVGVRAADLRNGTADAPATMPDHLPTAHLTSTARRPAGIPAGARYGTSSVAGMGTPESKRTPSSRKAGPKGGIGGSMVTGRTSIGNGAPGSQSTTRKSAECNGHADATLAGSWCDLHRVYRCTGETA